MKYDSIINNSMGDTIISNNQLNWYLNKPKLPDELIGRNRSQKKWFAIPQLWIFVNELRNHNNARFLNLIGFHGYLLRFFINILTNCITKQFKQYCMFWMRDRNDWCWETRLCKKRKWMKIHRLTGILQLLYSTYIVVSRQVEAHKKGKVIND